MEKIILNLFKLFEHVYRNGEHVLSNRHNHCMPNILSYIFHFNQKANKMIKVLDNASQVMSGWRIGIIQRQ